MLIFFYEKVKKLLTENVICDNINIVRERKGQNKKENKDISNRIEKDDKNQQTINWCKYQLCN